MRDTAFSRPSELDARYEVLLEQYTEQIVLEGRVAGRHGAQAGCTSLP